MTWILGLGVLCGIWYIFVLLVQFIGFIQLFRHYSTKPRPAVTPTLKQEEIPHITILRPVKGLEPQLYECLAATFKQTYPLEKLTIYFCIASTDDPAYPVLKCLLTHFPQFDAKIFVEEDDPNLSGLEGLSANLGPNPKIRNMSRGYREAKGNIVWIMDCNVWVGKGVAGRMVDKLYGYTAGGARVRPCKFVHQLPLVVDSVGTSAGEEARGLSNGFNVYQRVPPTNNSAYQLSSTPKSESQIRAIFRKDGGRLEEMFMASSHAKFYTAINTISVAPCIVGKSNMFRRSHLNYLTTRSTAYSPGIDFFSENICEDHLIGDLLWRKKVREEEAGEKWNKHGLVFGDLAIQPMAGMPLKEYLARRVRWLRVRKWTVTLATLVEPGVEPLLCSAYGAFAVITLPWFHEILGMPQTWLAFSVFWIVSILLWMGVDWLVYARLHSCASVELDTDTPSFAQPPPHSRRQFGEWLCAWLGRELLALPIWIWACLGGTTVMWRGKKFRVGLDMRVSEIKIKIPEGKNRQAQSKKSK
ncbi:hypothetical protein B7494_g8169 [Chlorociboria aeruginascens]|nr:hypothetical protein B7494_g8169 [Chlorociboria aeruginascens]